MSDTPPPGWLLQGVHVLFGGTIHPAIFRKVGTNFKKKSRNF